MTTVKRAVSLDEDVERAARELAGSNFSAFVNAALERHVRAQRLERLVRDDARERGALDEGEVEAVGRELDELDRA